MVQGTTVGWLLRKLKLVGMTAGQAERELRWGRFYKAQAGQKRMEQLHEEGVLTGDIWAGISEEYRETSRKLANEVDNLYGDYPELERSVVLQARREALKAERSALREAMVRGWLSSKVHEGLVEDVDNRLEAVRLVEETTTAPRVQEDVDQEEQ
jgi:hypothetical protein